MDKVINFMNENNNIVIDGKLVFELEQELKRLQHYQAEFEHELMNNYTYDGYISPNGFTPIDVIKHIKSELKRLEQENEKLKKEIQYDSRYNDMQAELDCGEKLISKYRQALQEIRKYIAKICKEECGYVQKKRCPDSDCRYGQILDKINSVIGAE